MLYLSLWAKSGSKNCIIFAAISRERFVHGQAERFAELLRINIFSCGIYKYRYTLLAVIKKHFGRPEVSSGLVFFLPYDRGSFFFFQEELTKDATIGNINQA